MTLSGLMLIAVDQMTSSIIKTFSQSYFISYLWLQESLAPLKKPLILQNLYLNLDPEVQGANCSTFRVYQAQLKIATFF